VRGRAPFDFTARSQSLCASVGCYWPIVTIGAEIPRVAYNNSPSGLKGRNNPAQGNALGLQSEGNRLALKGRNKNADNDADIDDIPYQSCDRRSLSCRNRCRKS